MTLSPQIFSRLPDAVLFDLDNTFYNYFPAHEAGMQAVRAKAMRTFNIKAEQFDAAFQEARKETKARLGKTAAAHSRLLYFQRMLEMIGLGTQALLALDFEQCYWRSFLTHAELFEGALEFLDDLRLARIPVAIVTNLTAQIQFRKMLNFGLDAFISCLVTSEEAGHDKPHAAPFELAMAKLQVESTNIWMVGDEPKSDIYGARTALNAKTLQKLHDGVAIGKGDEAPDGTFRHFSELSQLLKRLKSE